MITPTRSAIAVAFSVLMLVSGVPAASANGPNPQPSPEVHVKLRKDGVQVKAVHRAIDRLSEAAPSRAPRRNPTARRARNTQRSKSDFDRVRPRDEFRLNLDACGSVTLEETANGPTRCLPPKSSPLPYGPPPEPVPDDQAVVQTPQPSDVTWTVIRSQVADGLFPPHRAKVQPAGRTLVNLDTIVYTDPTTVTTRTVTLLGFPVTVEATPMGYTWNFGDGTPALSTTSPGAPYPSKEITHKYLHRGSAAIRVTTHYAARFDVAGTGWQYVDGTVPIAGPPTTLLVREAVPVLVDPSR